MSAVLAAAVRIVSNTAAAAAAETAAAALEVCPGTALASIAQALDLAAAGATIIVHSGRYAERLVIRQPVTLRVAAGATVELVWETDAPYESAIECSSAGVDVAGIAVRHRSPSIANNYAVRLVGCDARLADCDVSSASGSALGIEGGSPQVLRCALHDCARSGAMVFGELDGSDSSARIQDCTITGNKLHGVVVRDGAAPEVAGNTIARCKGFGLALQGCGGVFAQNALSSNGAGAVAYNLLEDVDVDELASLNGLPVSALLRKAL